MVSYPGGTMPMLEITGDHTMLAAHYSPTARYSLGASTTYLNDDNAWLHFAEANWLAIRKNYPASQANFYLRGGAGVAEAGGRTAPAGFAGIIADWEDRRYMVAYDGKYTMSALGRVDSHLEQRFRAGIAPYKAPYEDWQPWMILQIDHHPEGHTPLEVTPVLRAFKGPVLGELGISNKGDLFFALNYQF